MRVYLCASKYMCCTCASVGGRVGIRVSFKEMIGDLEKEELEGQKAISKTSASPPPQLFSILPPCNQQPNGDLMNSAF